MAYSHDLCEIVSPLILMRLVVEDLMKLVYRNIVCSEGAYLYGSIFVWICMFVHFALLLCFVGSQRLCRAVMAELPVRDASLVASDELLISAVFIRLHSGCVADSEPVCVSYLQSLLDTDTCVCVAWCVLAKPVALVWPPDVHHWLCSSS